MPSPPKAQIPARAAFLRKPFRLVSLAEQLKLVTRKEGGTPLLPSESMFRFFRFFPVLFVLGLAPGRALAEPHGKLSIPASASSILDNIYSGRRDLALA